MGSLADALKEINGSDSDVLFHSKLGVVTLKLVSPEKGLAITEKNMRQAFATCASVYQGQRQNDKVIVAAVILEAEGEAKNLVDPKRVRYISMPQGALFALDAQSKRTAPFALKGMTFEFSVDKSKKPISFNWAPRTDLEAFDASKCEWPEKSINTVADEQTERELEKLAPKADAPVTAEPF